MHYKLKKKNLIKIQNKNKNFQINVYCFTYEREMNKFDIDRKAGTEISPILIIN